MSVKTGEVTREGDVGIKFSEPCDVPAFVIKDGRLLLSSYDLDSKTGVRKLVGVSELDVSRDVVDFDFVTESDQEAKPIGYYLEMKEWTEAGMGVQAVYDDPLMVGKGNDQIMTTLKDPSLIVTKASGVALDPKAATSVKESATQMKKGVKEADVVDQADTSKNAMTALIIAQLVAQAFLKGTQKDLWSLFLTLQIVVYMSFYSIVVPSNSSSTRVSSPVSLSLTCSTPKHSTRYSSTPSLTCSPSSRERTG